MGIKGGLHHQILYRNNVELIYEGHKGIGWNPPYFTLNGIEIPNEDYVEIHDDLFRRFHDYFNWIETYNPDGPKEFNKGFNYYGTTAMYGKNLMRFGNLIDSLSNLFENAPEKVLLTGDFCFDSPLGNNTSSDCSTYRGHYERVEVDRNELIKIFRDLRMMTDRAIKNNGYLLHLGI
jgi:hypothetical protein